MVERHWSGWNWSSVVGKRVLSVVTLERGKIVSCWWTLVELNVVLLVIAGNHWAGLGKILVERENAAGNTRLRVSA